MLGIFFITLFQTKKQLYMKKYITILYCQYCVNVIGLPLYFRFKTFSNEYLASLVVPTSKFHR